MRRIATLIGVIASTVAVVAGGASAVPSATSLPKPTLTIVSAKHVCNQDKLIVSFRAGHLSSADQYQLLGDVGLSDSMVFSFRPKTTTYSNAHAVMQLKDFPPLPNTAFRYKAHFILSNRGTDGNADVASRSIAWPIGACVKA